MTLLHQFYVKQIMFECALIDIKKRLASNISFFSGQIKRTAEIKKWVILGSFDGYLVPNDNDNFNEILEYEAVFDVKYKLCE